MENRAGVVFGQGEFRRGCWPSGMRVSDVCQVWNGHGEGLARARMPFGGLGWVYGGFRGLSDMVGIRMRKKSTSQQENVEQ